MSDIETVVKFFLNIFRLQTEFAERQTITCEYQPVADDTRTDQVFEFRAECGEKWKTRRMSIRQLGESVESKSTCFKVIYDDILVVKIPPRPFASFEVYLKVIQTEKAIAEQLSPAVACLSPSIAGILKKIPQIHQSKKQQLEDEEDYIRLLTQEPGLQNYLKIGNRLSFFMDLSRYAFLNQVLDSIHEKKSRIPLTINKNREALFHLDAFETIYGSAHDDIFFEMNRLYGKYQKSIDRVIAHTKGLLSIPDYLRADWFFDRLSGHTPEIQNAGYSAGTSQHIENALSTIMQEGENTITRYKKMVQAYVMRKIFENNRTKMAALIINTLELIARLKEQAVAVRDLKPDNIFVAKNFDGADHILGDPTTYDLGLIDLETAISFQNHKPETIAQPLMAGTPSFMTPSQLFSNPVLIELFGSNLPRIMYMQDWYASVGIIFKIITGHHLFYRTAKLIPEIIRLKKKNANQPTQTFKLVSWNFWHTASTELAEQIKAHHYRLENLQLNLTRHVRKTLAAEAIHENAILYEALHQMAYNQSFFPNSRKSLISATPENIKNHRLKFEKQPSGSKQQIRILIFLKTLETLKNQMLKTRTMINFSQKPVTVNGAELMRMLFYRAFYAMYNPTWSERGLPTAEVQLAGEENGFTSAAIQPNNV